MSLYQQNKQARVRLAELKEQAAACKENAVFPEQVLSSRRAEAKRRSAALDPERLTHALSSAGVKALEELGQHVAGLAATSSAADTQREYEQLAEAHRAAGTDPPSLYGFMLSRLHSEGNRMVNAISFELMRPAEQMHEEGAAEQPPDVCNAAVRGLVGSKAHAAAVPPASRARPLHGGYTPY